MPDCPTCDDTCTVLVKPTWNRSETWYEDACPACARRVPEQEAMEASKR